VFCALFFVLFEFLFPLSVLCSVFVGVEVVCVSVFCALFFVVFEFLFPLSVLCSVFVGVEVVCVCVCVRESERLYLIHPFLFSPMICLYNTRIHFPETETFH